MTTVRPSREAVARWNTAYAEQTAAMFAAMRAVTGDVAAVRRLARATSVWHTRGAGWPLISPRRCGHDMPPRSRPRNSNAGREWRTTALRPRQSSNRMSRSHEREKSR